MAKKIRKNKFSIIKPGAKQAKEFEQRKQLEYNNNLGIRIETKQEKERLIEILEVFQKELERLEF